MSALSPEQTRFMRRFARRAGARGDSSGQIRLAGKWQELHARAADLAQLAQLSPEPFAGEIAAFPDRLNKATPRQRDLVRQGLEDLEAMMQPGLVALETLRRRGRAVHVPALALWREFYTARTAVMALARV